jgi:hypothetical protein
MYSELSNIRRIESAEGIPAGTYRGTWCGYVVEFETPFGCYEAQASNGVRGTTDCKVIVEPNGEMFVDAIGAGE